MPVGTGRGSEDFHDVVMKSHDVVKNSRRRNEISRRRNKNSPRRNEISRRHNKNSPRRVVTKSHHVLTKFYDVVMIVSGHVLIRFHDFQTVRHSQIAAGIQNDLLHTGPLYKTFDKASHHRLLYKLAS